MIEPYEPYIEQLLRDEPWRAEAGAPTTPCLGSLSYDGTHFWLCSCGRIGRMPIVAHFPHGGHTKAFFRRFVRALRPSARVA
jgi:hypothetical protein